MLWFAIVALAFIYITNTVLAFLQTKNYTSAFTTLRRRGRVAIGKKKGVFRSGAIVLLLILLLRVRLRVDTLTGPVLLHQRRVSAGLGVPAGGAEGRGQHVLGVEQRRRPHQPRQQPGRLLEPPPGRHRRRRHRLLQLR